VENNPLSLTDPSGMSGGSGGGVKAKAQDATSPMFCVDYYKGAEEASDAAKRVMKSLKVYSDSMEKFARNTKDVERGGVLVETKEARGLPNKSIFIESISKDPKKQGPTHVLPPIINVNDVPYPVKPNSPTTSDGTRVVDWDKFEDPNKAPPWKDATIIFTWHVHTPDAAIFTSPSDRNNAKKRKIPSVVMHYKRAQGDQPEQFEYIIIDVDGKCFDFDPRLPRGT